ncbi:ABC transporter permease [Microcystis aeruginosa BLCCF158]|uniref:Transport permease protein n=1 Tax=Microcystis aeruginosa BLCC-F158 TaxID=2755316 RepID=A0A841V2W4_MICAE|nr:ABC transporter permease [Microcystis aeruginosa]MBC1196568.1 ABC transporter permease [Microcystis aeruginosa BLCC-F158]
MKYWQEILAIAQRILVELIRRGRSLILWGIFPILVLLLNGYIMAEKGKIELAEAMALATPPTLVGAALFFSCLGGTVATVVAEREQQTIKRLFLSPLSGVSYFIGIFLAHCVIAACQTILVYSIAKQYGANFKGSIPLELLIIFLSITAYVGLGFILGTQLAKRTEDVNALVGTFGVPLLILGGVFLPTALFPDNILSLAKYNPIYHMNEALIAVWAKGEDLQDISSHFRFLCLFALAMVAGGWLTYRQMLNLERRL